MSPRLVFSAISGTVYVVTRYREEPHPTDPRRTILLVIGDHKYDVTDQVPAMAQALARWKRNEKRRKEKP